MLLKKSSNNYDGYENSIGNISNPSSPLNYNNNKISNINLSPNNKNTGNKFIDSDIDKRFYNYFLNGNSYNMDTSMNGNLSREESPQAYNKYNLKNNNYRKTPNDSNNFRLNSGINSDAYLK